MRAILIRPMARTVEEIDIDMTTEAIQRAVGGSMQIAHEYGNGDTLYVNENGIGMGADAMAGEPGMSEFAALFELGLHQPFFGPGIIVGRWEGASHTDARTPLGSVRAAVSFLHPKVSTAKPGPSGPN